MVSWSPRPFVFVHIPKCAGTSIEKALIPCATGWSDFSDLSDRERTRFWLPGKDRLQHSKVRDYELHFALDDFFTFAIVRNPWDRAVSQILYLKKRGFTSLFDTGDFKQHIKTYCQATRTVAAQDLGACQIDYITDRSGRVRVDFVGRFETLDQDFATVSSRIELRSPPRLPHIFASKRKPYHSYYDDESSAWIQERFARDIEYFHYSFADGTHSVDLQRAGTGHLPLRCKR